MKIILNKQEMLETMDKKINAYDEEDMYQCYEHEFDSEERLTKEETIEMYNSTKEFIESLTEEQIIKSAEYLTKKKNGKPRKGSIVHLHVGDVGYWFAEWYVSFSTYRIVSRASDENTIEVSLEDYVIDGDSYPIIINLEVVSNE